MSFNTQAGEYSRVNLQIVVANSTADSRRAGLCPSQQTWQRIAIRRNLGGLRTDQRDRHDEPAVRAMDRGTRKPATDWSRPGPANTSLPYPGGNRRELSTQRRQKTLIQEEIAAD